jgi:hypothetical protein
MAVPACATMARGPLTVVAPRVLFPVTETSGPVAVCDVPVASVQAHVTVAELVAAEQPTPAVETYVLPLTL